MELKGQCDRQESRIQFNEERLQELEQQNFKAFTEIAEAEQRTNDTQQELAGVTERLAASNAALEQQRATLDEKHQVLQQVEAETQRQAECLRKAQSEAFAAMQQLTRARNEINALDLQKQGNIVRLEKLSSEKIQLEEERARLEARLTEFATNVQTEKLNAQTQRGTVEERQQRLREILQELNLASQELDGFLRQQAEKRSRLNVLEQLQESHEGFSAGALAALKQSQSVLGSLADKIRVPDQHVIAIEAALGHHLQLVLTEQPEAAQQILSDLAANKKGKASIAALNLMGMRSTASDSSNAQPSEIRDGVEPILTGTVSALGVIEADASVQPLLAGLLGRTLIVSDLAAATAALRDCNGAFDFVTQTGELLTRHGIFTGGSGNGNGNKAPGSILGRKNQIAELQAQLAQIQEQVNEASRKKGALQSEQTALQASLQQAQTELRNQEVAIAAHEGEFNALQNSSRSLNSKIETVIYEVQALAAHEQEGREKRAVLAAQVAEVETREQVAQAQVTDLTTALEQLRHQRDGANTTLTEAKVALAGEEQLCASLARQKGPLEQRPAQGTVRNRDW
jgi:chromosome segregation protein